MIYFNKNRFFKAHKWWDSHIVLMMGVIYATLSRNGSLPGLVTFLEIVVLFLVSSIGIAAFGQMFNDLYDRVQDGRTGAPNMMLGKKPPKIIIMFLSVLLIAWVPWIWLPHQKVIWSILCLEYLLFILYSQPPIRLKSRGIFGAMADSTYAYVNSNMVAALLFSSLSKGYLPSLYLVLLVAWTFTMGLRQILFHQLIDANRDLSEGINTFVVRYGALNTFRFLIFVLIPGEFLLFLSFLIYLGISAFYIPILFIIFTVYIYFRERKQWIWNTKNPIHLPSITMATLFTDRVMDHFMMGWFPMLMLAPLCLRQPWYLVVAALHYFIFENGPKRVIRYDILPRLARR